jgi:hypothetical protein
MLLCGLVVLGIARLLGIRQERSLSGESAA